MRTPRLFTKRNGAIRIYSEPININPGIIWVKNSKNRTNSLLRKYFRAMTYTLNEAINKATLAADKEAKRLFSR